jgi:uncharacterized protein YndB with AHSA1/START domain
MNETLVIRRRIHATRARVFAAWTEPAQLMKWWGPPDVVCDHAEVDLRVGGEYRLSNRFADGSVLWIIGAFEHIDPPTELVYTWRLDPGDGTLERVHVRFDAMDDTTEITVTHERIVDAPTRDRHASGWHGCLDGLTDLLEGGPRPST